MVLVAVRGAAQLGQAAENSKVVLLGSRWHVLGHIDCEGVPLDAARGGRNPELRPPAMTLREVAHEWGCSLALSLEYRKNYW